MISPPRPRLPPLNALRAFEAAARLNGISMAAKELCVTPAAVAQQVKSLEAWTGERLFKRNPQGVELTPLGARVLTDFSAAFDALGSAVQRLRTEAAPQEIRIAALPGIAQLWVSPRLPRIRSAMPELAISVSALEQRPNMLREPFDLAIFYEDEGAAGQTIAVCRDVIFPVCSPSVAARLNTVEDLADETFLHDTTWRNDWSNWLSIASPDRRYSDKGGPEFSLYSLALEECKNGAGILIGHDALVRGHMENGQLVAPYDLKVTLPGFLGLTARTSLEADPVLNRVATMLMADDTI